MFLILKEYSNNELNEFPYKKVIKNFRKKYCQKIINNSLRFRIFFFLLDSH